MDLIWPFSLAWGLVTVEMSCISLENASLRLTKISKVKDANTYNIVANMTVKGITHAESFVANVSEVDGNYVATADVTIDRSKYDVRYGSTSFFDDLGDKAINNDFTLKVTIATPMK